MFTLRGFVKRGLLDAVGRQPDYWVILNAAGWMDKGVLTVDDLEEIQAAIDAQYAEPETEEPETGQETETEQNTEPEETESEGTEPEETEPEETEPEETEPPV